MSKQAGYHKFRNFFRKNWILGLSLSLGIIGLVLSLGLLFGEILNNNTARAAGETVQFASSSASGPESTALNGIPVTLSQAVSSNVTVNYNITGGSAVNGTDYVLTGSNIAIEAGKTQATIPFRILNNSKTNSNKTIQVSLSSPSGASLGTPSTFVFTIIDDDTTYNPLGSDPDNFPTFNYGNINSLEVTNGLQLQLDAGNISGSDGSVVSTWNDTSGTNHNATQTITANKPILKKAGNGINNKNVVRFDGLDDSLDLPDFLNFPSQQATEIVVMRQNSIDNQWAAMETGNQNNDSYWGTNSQFSYAGNWGEFRNSRIENQPNNQTALGNFTFTTITGSAPGSYKVFRNGSNVLTADPQWAYDNTPRIGAGYGKYLTGDIAEILIYNRAINDNERTQVECYLNTKYALGNVACTNALKLQLDASSITGLDGTPINTWSDISGNNNNATQSTTTNQPILKSGLNGINGKNVVRFNGDNNFLNLPNGFDNFDSGLSSFVVARPDKTKDWSRFYDLGNGQDSNNIVFNRYSNTQEVSFQNTNGGGQNTLYTSGQALTNNQSNLFSVNSQRGETSIYRNGHLAAQGNTGEITNIVRTSNFIGKSNYPYDAYYSGGIAEIIIYNRNLSDNERKQVECYLSKKYDLESKGCITKTQKLSLDASKINQTDNTPVSVWNDTSENGFNATQSLTTAQPKLRTNIINGKNVIRFNGTNQFLGNISANLIPDDKSYNVIAVEGRTSASANYFMGSTTCTGFGNDCLSLGYPDSTTLRLGQNGNDLEGIIPAYSAQSFKINSFNFNKDIGHQLFSQGTSLNTNTEKTGLIQTAGFNLGKIWDNTYYTGDIAEVIVYSSSLNTAQRTILENYLAGKYNLTISNSKYNLTAAAPNELVGIGSESEGIDNYSGSSSGLYLADNGNSLGSGEYLLAGNDNGTKTTAATSLPAGATQRLNRIWGIKKTSVDGINAKLNFDLSEYSGILPGAVGNYKLLYRSGTSGNFSIVTASSATIDGDKIVFAVPNANLLDGYYTLATEDTTNSPLAVPVAITNLAATTSGTQANLTWSAPAGTPTDYIIQYSKDNFINDLQVFNDGVSTTTSASVTGLSGSTKYAFRVIPVNTAGSGSPSNAPTITTVGTIPIISSLSPNAGSTVGGYEVTVNGSNFSIPSYKKQITVSNTGSAQTNYELSLTLDTKSLIAAGKLRSNCGDIRFYDTDDFNGLTYYLENGCNTVRTSFWIKIPTLAAAGNTNIFVHYGNPNDTTASNPYGFSFGSLLFGSNNRLWIDANSADLSNGEDATTILNKADPNNNLTVQTNYNPASLKDPGINSKASFNFDANDSYSFNRISDIRSAFWVLKESTDQGGFLLGDTDATDFHRNGANLWEPNYSSSYVRNGETRINNNLVSPSTDATLSVDTPTVVSLVTIGNVQANSFTEDRNGIFGNRNFKGDISEVILFNSALNNTDRQYIENYLNLKYSVYGSNPVTSLIGSEQSLNPISLTFGSNSASNITVNSSAIIKAKVPANSTPGGVTVTLSINSQNATSSFTYFAPSISSISPTSGPTTGGTEVTINGNYFSAGNFKRKLSINNSATATTNYQLQFTLDTQNLISNSKMRSDCGDLRIKNSALSTDLDYYIESGCNTSTSKIWVKIPSLPAGNTDIYLVYGDLSLTAQSSGKNVFDFFDDFSGSTIDITKWSETDLDSHITQNNKLIVDGGQSNWTDTGLYTKASFNRANSLQFEADWKWTGGDSAMLGWKDLSSSLNYTNFAHALYSNGNNGDDVYENGSNLGDSGLNWVLNQQYRVKVVMLPTGGALYYRSTDNGNTWELWKNTSANGITDSPLRVGFTSYVQAFEMDNAKVRKYITTDPIVTFDTEINPLSVTFDTISAQILSISSTQIKVLSPAHAVGSVIVKVINSDNLNTGTSSSNSFTYLAPAITSISPTSGATTGGTEVTFNGTNFVGGGYKRDIVINNPGTTLTNYQLSFNINTSSLISQGKMRSDCGDLRVKNATGNSDSAYFITQGCNSENTTVWTKVPTLAPGTNTIQVVYGNLADTSQANADNVFLLYKDFETGDLFDFTSSGMGWEITSAEKYQGQKSAANQDIGDGGSTSIEKTITASSGLHIEYYDKVSSEPGYDYLRFYINDVEKSAISGEEDWTKRVYSTDSGAQTLKWNYSKDSSVSNGQDTGYIDSLIVTTYSANPPTLNLGNESTLTKVYFGANLASGSSLLSSTQLKAISPAGSGIVAVKMVSPDGTVSNTNISFTYAAPTIASINPNSGPNIGGTYVTISGNNFGNAGNRYIRVIQAKNTTASSVNNFVSNVNLDTASLISQGKMRSDCGDLRVKNGNNTSPFGSTDTANVFSYWVENCNTAATTVWFKIPTLEVGSKNFYLSYGDQNLTTTQNITSVFPGLGGNNNQLWLKADSGIVSTSDSSIVSTWSDQSGNSNDATQTNSSYAPVYKKRILNGKPIVRTVNGHFLEISNSITTGTVVGVFNYTRGPTFDGNYRSLIGHDASNIIGAINQGKNIYSDYAGTTYVNGVGNANVSEVDFSPITQFKVVSTKFNTPEDLSDLKLFERDFSSSSWEGDLAEILVFDNSLSDTNRQSVENYLNLKYKLYNQDSNLSSSISSEQNIDAKVGNAPIYNLNFVDYQTVKGFVASGTGASNVSVSNSDGVSGNGGNIYTYGVNKASNPILDLKFTSTEVNTVKLAWTAPFNNGSNISDYIVKYSQNNFSTETILNDGVNNNTYATISGLTQGQPYQFKVIAVNGIGNSPDSNILSVSKLDCDNDLQGGDLIPVNGAVLTGSYCNVNNFYVGSGVTVNLNNQPTDLNNTYNKQVKIYAQQSTILGTINGDYKGYQGGTIENDGNGSGSSSYFETQNGSAGYGGEGGSGQTLGGKSYGSVTEPTDLGSGAGSSLNTRGGNGGGSIKLSVVNTLNLQGSVNVNGENYQTYQGYESGAGSGGSIWIQAGNFNGNGNISARGGNGNSTSGAGGGRIAIYYANKTFSGNLTASGGYGNRVGGAGTIYNKASAQTYGNLDINNSGSFGSNIANTPINTDNFSLSGLDNLIIGDRVNVSLNKDLTIFNSSNFNIDSGTTLTINGTLTANNIIALILYGKIEQNGVLNTNSLLYLNMLNGSRFISGNLWNSPQLSDLSISNSTLSLSTYIFPTLNTLTLINYATLTSKSNTTITEPIYKIDLSMVDLYLESGSVIDVSEKGYQGGDPGNNGNGLGKSDYGLSNPGGAGYGGYGGQGETPGGAGYGSYSQPTDLGSGGAGSIDGKGGAGGGSIKLQINNNLILEGTIKADGGQSTGYSSGSGAGSGGSIWIQTNNLSGNGGTISANGGSAYSSGGGAGGRIALYYQSRSDSQSIYVDGGYGNGDCTETQEAAYPASTSGCTGTIYDPNTPEVNLTSASVSTNPNPVSVDHTFAVLVTNVRNTFDAPLFAGTCQVALTGPGNYTSTITRNGVINSGKCILASDFDAPTATGTMTAVTTVSNNTTESKTTTFTIYSPASNKAKAQLTPNEAKPIYTTLSSNPINALIQNAGPTLSAIGFVDSQNNQALNGVPCIFHLTGPNSYTQNFVSPVMIGGSCSYTFSLSELPNDYTQLSGTYQFTVTVAGRDISSNDLDLTTDSAYFNRYYDIYLESTTPGVYNYQGKIPGVNTSDPSTIPAGSSALFTSPAIRKFDNVTLVDSSTNCTILSEINDGYSPIQTATYYSTLNNQGKCVVTAPSSNFSNGILRIKTKVTLVVNGYSLDFETNWTTIPTSGFSSNLAKYNPTPTITTPELQPVYTTQSATPDPSFIYGNTTLSLTGLLDSNTSAALNGQVCTFVITKPDSSVLSINSTNITEGACQVSLSDAELGNVGGNFSFRVQIPGKDASNQNAVLTTPTTQFSRLFNIYLIGGTNGLTGSIPGVISTDPNALQVNTAATIYSPVINKYNNSDNLDYGTLCRNIVRFVDNSNQQTTLDKDSSLVNGVCSTALLDTDLPALGTAYISTRISLSGSDLDTPGATGNFQTAETPILVKGQNNAKICTNTFRDDNLNGIWNTQALTGSTNQFGQDEPTFTGVNIKLLDSNLQDINGATLISATPTPDPDVNCFKDLYDGSYYLEQSLPADTTFTFPDTTNPPAGVTILRNGQNQVTGIRYQITLAAGEAKTINTGYNANSQICLDYTFADKNGNGIFDGNDVKISRATKLYFSNDLNTVLATLNASTTASTCFTNLPPSAYDTYSLNYTVEQNIPQIGDPDFDGGAELTSTSQTLSGNVNITVSAQENGTKARTSDLSLGNSQGLSNLNFGYRSLASLKALAQDTPNQTQPVYTDFSFASVVNNLETPNKVYKGYKFTTRVNGLIDSASNQPLTIPNTATNYAQACSITFSGPSFNSAQQAYGTISNGTCEVDPNPDNAGTGNTATMTVAGESGNLTATGSFDVLSGNVDICSYTFADYNLDQDRQTNEAYLAGRTIKLFNNSTNTEVQSSIVSTTTGSDCFTGVAPGIIYRLEETVLSNNFVTTNSNSAVYIFTPVPEENQTFKFGYRGNNTICPYSFRDDTGNGTRNTNAYGNPEPMVNNIFTATLQDNFSNEVGSFLVDNSTCFSNLLPGDYTLSQSFDNALKLTRTNFVTGNTEITGLSANTSVSKEFGYQNQATICPNPSFNDYNKNGLQDTGESTIDGLVTKLFKVLTNQQIGPDLLVNGTNCFTSIIPDDYRIEQTKPSGGILTTTSTSGITYSQNSTTSTILFTAVLGLDQNLPFGYKGSANVCPYPTFRDLNKNGLKDSGDTDINGVVTYLKDNNGNIVATLQTDSGSQTCFTEILPGNYRLLQDAPENTTSTTGGTDKAIDNLLSGQTRSVAFGYNGDPKICPVTYRDDNSNLVYDLNEVRLAGVLVTLKDATGATTIATLTTSTSNTNCFTNLTSVTYKVEVGNLANYSLTTLASQTVTVGFGESASPAFGYNGSGSICVDPTFRDKNSNAIFDNNETKFSGVNTYLKYTDGNLVVPLQVTDTNGITCFTGVAPGQYIVSQDAPEGSTSTTGESLSILLNPGENQTLAFGYNGSGSICPNPTFNDLNFDGVKNTTETLITGINTRLYLQSDPGTMIASLTTDSGGTNCFVGLFPDNYRLVQDVPSGYGVSSSTTGGTTRDFALTAGEYKTIAFGYTNNPDFALAAIRGFLYIDRNENSVYNPNGQDAAQITVFDNDIPVTKADVRLYKKNTTTNVYDLQSSQLSISDPANPETDGTFGFLGLQPGDYKVSIIPQPGTKSVTPNPSERLITITSTEKVLDQYFGFQYTARICPSLYVDKNKNSVFDTGDLDLIASRGAYYQLSYESFSGTQVASNYNSYGFLLTTSNPCIENIPPRDYTLVFRADLTEMLSYSTAFDVGFYNQISPNQVVTIYLGNQVNPSNRFYTDFTPDYTNSVIKGQIWNNRPPREDFDADGYDDQTGINGGFNRNYDNDFNYTGIQVSLKKCSPGFGETQTDVDTWNSNKPTSITDSNGNYTFSAVPPGGYAVIRNTTLPFEAALAGLNPNDCEPQYNNIFINNSYQYSGGYTPGSTIDYNILAYYKANINNILYLDQNHNNQYDTWETNGELGDSQFGQITLKDSNNNISGVQNTNASNIIPPYGSTFASVPPDNYSLSLAPDSANYPLILPDQNPKTAVVTTATDAVNLNYGFNPTNNSSITGKLFIDRNSDNIYQGGGADLNSATTFDNDIATSNANLELYYGAGLNPVSAQFVASTTTDSNGNYSFTGLSEGFYSLRITTQKPAGTNCIRCDWGVNQPGRYDIVYLNKDTTSTQNLTYNYNANLSIRAFHDTIANAIRDTAEIDARNMLFTVTSTDGYNLGTFGPGILNLDGPQFANLPSGTYSININSIPSGISLTGGYSTSDNVNILPSENYSRDYPFTPYTNNSIQGYAFVDRNMDNELNLAGEDNDLGNTFDNEKPFTGSTIRISGPLGTYSTTTDTNGFYQFTGLATGNYKLQTNSYEPDLDLNDPLAGQIVFRCYTAITCKYQYNDADGQRSYSFDSGQIDAISHGISLINTTSFNTNYTYVYTGTINARCIDDLNGDGSLTYYADTGYTESTITGCSFRLTTPTGEFLNFDPNQNITASNLPPGNYTVTKLNDAPNRYNTNTTKRDVTPNINLGNQSQVSVTFNTAGGAYQKAYYNFMQFTQPITNNSSITGKTYIDRAQDMVYQASGLDNLLATQEDNDILLPDVPIGLTGTTPSGSITRNTITNIDGKYQFTDLPAGNFTVTADLSP